MRFRQFLFFERAGVEYMVAPGWHRVLLFSFLFLLGVMAGVWLDSHVLQPRATVQISPQVSAQDKRSDEYHLLVEAWDGIRKNYVDQPSIRDRKFTYKTIEGMLDALGDPEHSQFLTPEMRQEEQEELSGQFAGIGIQLEEKGQGVVISSLFRNAPAQRNGLRVGDVVVAVDTQKVAGMSAAQTLEAVRGPAGSAVTIEVRDSRTAKSRHLKLVREPIGQSSVSWVMLPGSKVALVRLDVFSSGTTEALAKALAAMGREGARGIVLDLRDNPGGYLTEAVGVASQFLLDGRVVLEKDRKGNLTYLAVRKDLDKTDLPLVVLINNETASSAEIVAGALQDAQRGKLLGVQTFGAGTVLSEVPLSDGSSMMIAVEEWLTPKGRTIWRKGIPPDVEVSQGPNAGVMTPQAIRERADYALDLGRDAQLMRGVELLTRSGKTGS